MMDLRELYQEVIVDHNREPRNCYAMQSATTQADGFNPLCGDKLTLFLQLEEEKIKSASFVGCGCAISIASASLMTEYLNGKTIEEAKADFSAFHNMIMGKVELKEGQLSKLTVLAGVREFPSRVKCATLAWHTLQAALNNDNKPATTE